MKHAHRDRFFSWLTESPQTHLWFAPFLTGLLTDSLMTLSKKTSLWAKKSNTKYWRAEKRGRIMNLWQIDWATGDLRHSDDSDTRPLQFYLIEKGSIGPLFDWSLFLLIADLNNNTGVDVFSHQLSGLCDVNGNLWDGQKVQGAVAIRKASFFIFIKWEFISSVSFCIQTVICVGFSYVFPRVISILNLFPVMNTVTPHTH